MLLIGIFHIGLLIKPRSVILARGRIFLLIDQEYITQAFSVEYIVQSVSSELFLPQNPEHFCKYFKPPEFREKCIYIH